MIDYKKIADNDRRKEVLQNRIDSRATFLNELMHQIGKSKIEGPDYSVILKKQQSELKISTMDILTQLYIFIVLLYGSIQAGAIRNQEFLTTP